MGTPETELHACRAGHHEWVLLQKPSYMRTQLGMMNGVSQKPSYMRAELAMMDGVLQKPSYMRAEQSWQ
jgi:hypothetical protein